MWKRLTAWAVAVLALGSAVSPAAAFSDTDGLETAGDIAYLEERGIVQGTAAGRFSPDAPLERGQAVAALGRMAEITGRGGVSFPDVPPDAYYAPALGWAEEAGLVESGGAFGAEEPMTHRELAALLTAYLGWLGREERVSPAGEGAVSRGEAASYFAGLDRRLMDRETSLRTLMAEDGVTLTGKLDLPAGEEPVEKLVLFINGSGANTYDNRRQSGDLTFNYFDLFAQQLGARGVGFFRWSTRGAAPGDTPPMFTDLDLETFRTYLPATSVSDAGAWIAQLRQEPRLRDAELYLLGWSEGTIIAPLVARAWPEEVDGLLLAGYCNDRMDEIFDWQQTGGASMVFYRQYFDADGDGRVSPAEFAGDPYGVVESVLGGASFAEIDLDGDGFLTAADFAAMLAPGREAFLSAVERGDDAWLLANYGVSLTSGWFRAHRALRPNREVLPELDLPIAIFHGTGDANCDVAGVYAIQERFRELGKDNLAVHIYEGYDHDLFYSLYPLTGAMPRSFEDIFQTLAG